MGGLVKLSYFADYEEALVAQSFLRAMGVEAFFAHEYHTTVDPNVRLALGGCALWVRADVYGDASDVLRQVVDGSRESAIEVERCEICGGADFSRRRNFLWAAVSFFYGAAYAPYAGRKVCAECGARLYSGGSGALPRFLLVLFGAGLLLWALWP